MLERVAVFGVSGVGGSIARTLLKRGHPVTLHAPQRCSISSELVGMGAVFRTSACEAVINHDLVITAMTPPTSSLSHIADDCTWLDLSGAVNSKDCPESVYAVEASMPHLGPKSMFLAGSENVSVNPELLHAIGGRLIRVGDGIWGNARRARALTGVLFYTSFLTLTECLALGKSLGWSTPALAQALRESTACSMALTHGTQFMFDSAMDNSNTLKLALSELEAAQAMGSDSALPLVAVFKDTMSKLGGAYSHLSYANVHGLGIDGFTAQSLYGSDHAFDEHTLEVSKDHLGRDMAVLDHPQVSQEDVEQIKLSNEFKAMVDWLSLVNSQTFTETDTLMRRYSVTNFRDIVNWSAGASFFSENESATDIDVSSSSLTNTLLPLAEQHNLEMACSKLIVSHF